MRQRVNSNEFMRQPFQEQADEDKIRYETEKAEYDVRSFTQHLLLLPAHASTTQAKPKKKAPKKEEEEEEEEDDDE